MKKILVLLLALVLCVCTLASCDFLNTIKGYIPGLGEETTTADNETPAAPTYDINAAVTYVYNLYKNKSITGADFDVTAVVAIKNAKYTVTWTVDTDKISISKKDDNTFTVNVDEEAPEELAYVLTATITAPDGQTGTKEFNLTVPKYVLWSHEQYMAAKENDTVVVKGIVVAINSKAAGNSRNHLFLADTKVVGGYYSYQMDQDPVADLGIEVGMTVEVTGPVTPYYGMQEIKGGTARIVDSNKQTVEVLDITDKVIAGESLANYVGLPVVMKNVEIAGQELGGTSDYLKFKIGEITSYVRTYVTDFPTTLKADDKATIDAAHADHFGWKANATGILVLYSGTPYLIPMGVDCFEYLELVVKTDAEKIADVLDQIKISTSFSSDEVVTLPTSVYSEVALTWASNNNAIAIADGKMTVVVPEAAVEVTVTVTATCGETTAEKVFTVKLSRVATPVKEIIDMALSMEHNVYTEGKYLVAGIITEVYNTQYGNMKITDEFGNILTIYGTYSADGVNRYDAMESKPVAGDYVLILGIVGQYNGTPQVKNGWIMSFTTPTSVKDAIDTGAAMEHNTYTTDKIIVSGVITEVYNTQYGNMKITDDAGNILTIYGTYSATGANRYDAMEGAPVAGDTVTIYGILGQYNGTPQVKNGWIVAVTKGSETPECTEHVDADGDAKCDNCGEELQVPPSIEDPAADSTLTIEQVLALGASKEHNTYTEGKYYVTGVIVEVYQTVYGNMKIQDEAGNILTVYGTFSADGTVRYDALEVKPVAGDTITVYGIVGQYNGTPQVKNGWITAHTAATPETPENPDAPANEVFNITAVGGTLADDGSQISWEADSFNIVSYKNTSSSAIRNSDADHFRCYAGTKFTLVGKTEAPIVKVVFTVTETKYASVLVENATAAGYTATADGKVVTVVVNATSLEFVNSAQVRINKIEVLYTENGTEVPPVVEPPVTNDPAADSTLTIEQVLALGASKEHNVYTEGKYYVTGVITEVYNTQYGNMKIKDDKGNILTVYGTYSADGSTRYDAMAVQPVVGDTITVYGIVGQYNGTPQVKNGWITAHTAGTGSTTPETPDTPATPTPDAEGKITYTFANYEAGVQYAANEVHKLDDKVTVTTNDAHFTKQIRLYQQSANDYGPARNGTAIFQTASAIKSLTINAGEKKVPIEVYGSTNGTDWVLITTITVESNSYVDFEITLGSTEYTYIKLAAIAGQARVAAVTFGF